MSKKSLVWTISVFAFVKLLVHCIPIKHYDLHRDEFLFAALGKHLDWGYFSVPPVIGFFSKMAYSIFGDTFFAYKLLPAVIGVAIISLAILIVNELGGKLFAAILTGCSLLFSIWTLRVGFLFQPVCFDIFFWTLSFYISLVLLNRNEPKLWPVLFLVLGLAFLSKYMIAIYFVGFFLVLLFSRKRILLRSPYFAWGALLGFFIVLPNILWQNKHHWVVLSHLQELKKTQLVNVSVTDFLADQLTMNINSFLVVAIGFASLFFKAEKKYRILILTVFTVFILLILTHGKSYYTLGIYPFAIAYGAYIVEKYILTKSKTIAFILFGFAVLIPIPLIPFGIPILTPALMIVYTQKIGSKTGLNRWEDGKIHSLPQDYADMLGWKEISNLTVKAYCGLSESDKRSCVIYAENYGQAGAILFYGKKQGLPDPISFSDAFLLWCPKSLDFKTLIYVNDEIEGIQKYFGKIELVGKVSDPLAREYGTGVYICTLPSEELHKFVNTKMEGLKNRF